MFVPSADLFFAQSFGRRCEIAFHLPHRGGFIRIVMTRVTPIGVVAFAIRGVIAAAIAMVADGDLKGH